MMTAIEDPNRNLSASTTSSTVTASEVFLFDLTFCKYSSATLLLVFMAATFLKSFTMMVGGTATPRSLKVAD
jgi:hypothetical protein